MARILVTGAADGIGSMTARLLVERGHAVVLHARNAVRARDALAAAPGAAETYVADLSVLAECRALAERANRDAPFDAVIHNAAIGYRERRRIETADGFAHVLAVNTLAPYVLAALMRPPRRLVFVSSELHRRGDPTLSDLNWERRPWNGNRAYCDTKLHLVILAFALARLWPEVRCNAMEPGWVRTKMSPRATGDLDAAHRTQCWLAADPDAAAVSGGYFFHLRPKPPAGAARDPVLQDRLLAECARLTGVAFPVPGAPG